MTLFSKKFWSETPVIKALLQATNKPHAAFYAPGHKRGMGINSELLRLCDRSVFAADLPELPELDNLFAPLGVINEAQQLAAKTFGAEKTWFLVNGSTCGIAAAILATCNPNDKIILPRNIHTSAISGLVLSGALPIFINPAYDSQEGLAYGITPEAVKAALEKHPDSKAVMMLYPTYQGVCGDIEAIANITHQYNLPLLVDEAHGAHFAFHPDLPPSALSAGADLTVQSTHKVLSAMSQASMLHLQSKRIAPQRISQALQLVQSTSPNYILLASLDAARQQMATQGTELMERTLNLATTARSHLEMIPKISVFQPAKQPGVTWCDRTRLTINVSQLGMTGFAADEILHQQLGVTCELPLINHLTFIISLGNTTEDIDKLIAGFQTLSRLQLPITHYPLPITHYPLPITRTAISPREAFFAESKAVPIEQASDRICTELICPYPPGIPLLMPGEKITIRTIDYLQQIASLGGMITGLSDPTLKTIKVIE
ncbi:aminotransferase class I/II-fold pyridoxal phosphate-dependent enzyme [Myxosarcina sp. GI1]|uniref:aminotransferase class I/II-fold pyridoxal phosphate-dependent enzyme n=1 Tax=Myxosarcina sp. GI1 TaxID=1541065 RepID=UPI00056554EC|nr:aminotransferase class I/II-fold pyridoxal phosphate-dependent enzyme [Myxosarcina sp. GI1]